jgi:hypothetical protein
MKKLFSILSFPRVFIRRRSKPALTILILDPSPSLHRRRQTYVPFDATG